MTRSNQTLLEQRLLVIAWLVGNIDREEAASIGTVRPSASGLRGSRTTDAAKFEGVVDGKLSQRGMLHLLTNGPAAVRQLHPAVQRVLFTRFKGGYTWPMVADDAGKSERTVRYWVDGALTTLAEWLWTDDGEPRLPPQPKEAQHARV